MPREPVQIRRLMTIVALAGLEFGLIRGLSGHDRPGTSIFLWAGCAFLGLGLFVGVLRLIFPEAFKRSAPRIPCRSHPPGASSDMFN